MRRFDITLATIEENLALDEALLLETEEFAAEPALRTWEFPGWAVVLGASCRLANDVDLEACQVDGVAIARRSSGGGTVLIGPGALNVAVVLPIDRDRRLKAVDEAQQYVLEALANAIRTAGGAVEVLGSGDLTVDGRKVAGSAQRRLRRNVLIHASILYDFPLWRIGRYLRPPGRQPAYRAGRSHADFLANLAIDRDDLVAAAEAAWLPRDEVLEPGFVPESLVARLVESKYAAEGWVSRL